VCREGRVLISIIGQIKSAVGWPRRSVSSEESGSDVPALGDARCGAPLMVFDRLLANSSDVD